jgi:hypothetical protein
MLPMVEWANLSDFGTKAEILVERGRRILIKNRK